MHREHAEKPVVAKRPISMDVDVAEDRPGADETADKRRRQFEEARQERLARLQQQNAQRRQAKAQARQQQAEQARELQKRRNELLQQRRQSALCEPQGSRSNSSSRSSLPRSRATTAASNASAGQRSTGRPQTQERVTDCQCSAQRSPDGARSNKRLIRNAVSYVCLAGDNDRSGPTARVLIGCVAISQAKPRRQSERTCWPLLNKRLTTTWWFCCGALQASSSKDCTRCTLTGIRSSSRHTLSNCTVMARE